MKKNVLIIFLLLSILFFPGCKSFEFTDNLFQNYSQKKKEFVEDSSDIFNSENNGLSSGMSIFKKNIFDKQNNLIDRVVLVFFENKEYQVEIKESDPPKNLKQWCSNKDYIAVINGGYFLENYKPTALIISNKGKTGSSYYDKTKGMFSVNKQEQLRIENLEKGANDLSGIKYALQSFPMLVENQSNVVVSNHGFAKRSFVALDNESNLIIGNSQFSSLNFFDLSNYLLGMDLNIETALGLDGGNSSGLCFRDKKGDLIYDDYNLSEIPNVIVVKKK